MTQPLPGVLGEIASVAGVSAAMEIAVRVGGTRVYIPASVGDDHWLVTAIGREAADKVCRHFKVDDARGQRIDIPLAKGGAYRTLRRRLAQQVHDMDKAHQSSRDIARETGLTQRTVHRHRAAHRGVRKTDPQGSLF